MAVAADGRGSERAVGGHRVTRWDYDRPPSSAPWATPAASQIAQEHFLPAGPFAILPLTGQRSSVVWTEKSHLADAILAQDDAAFLNELERRFGDFLGTLPSKGRAFPIRCPCKSREPTPRRGWRWSAMPRMACTRWPAKG